MSVQGHFVKNRQLL